MRQLRVFKMTLNIICEQYIKSNTYVDWLYEKDHS